jgi:hypothetical protein
LVSPKRVEEAAVPEDVSSQRRPLEVDFKVPTVEVAMEIAPVVPLIERAEIEVVAVPARVVVAKYKLPPALRVTQAAIPVPSVRMVLEATVRPLREGVVVPIPKILVEVAEVPAEG